MAWLGLLALAVPILIHWLARRTARVQRFPTLRFLETSRLLPRRRTRLTDLPLLMVRLGIILAAVAALAQPVLLTSSRKQTLERQLARAIVIDTSSSMQRSTAAGTRAIDAARIQARRHAAEAQASAILESAAPAKVLDGAAQWLRTQPGQRELVIVSDFQVGAIEEADIDALPADVGVRFERIELSADAQPIETRTRTGSTETITRSTLAADQTTAEWSVRPIERPDLSQVLLLTGQEEIDAAAAAMEAALTMAAPPRDGAHQVAIVYSAHASREQLLRDARTPNAPWMGDLALALGGDPTIERVARGTVDGRERLLVFTTAEPGSLASAGLIVSVLAALSPNLPASELEPESLPADLLKRWERAPSTVIDTNQGDDTSDGRWLWLLALLLIAIESWMRRSARSAARDLPTEAAYDRVA